MASRPGRPRRERSAFVWCVGINQPPAPRASAWPRRWTGAERAGFPVCVLSWGRMDFVDDLAQAPSWDVMIVVDHLGLVQTMKPPPPPDPFGDLDSVLALATYPNVVVKVTGACTLSHQPYPFGDLWAPIGPDDRRVRHRSADVGQRLDPGRWALLIRRGRGRVLRHRPPRRRRPRRVDGRHVAADLRLGTRCGPRGTCSTASNPPAGSLDETWPGSMTRARRCSRATPRPT